MVSGRFRVSTLVAWAPAAWVLLTLLGLWASILVPDWLCGPPGKDTCDVYRLHPGVFWYMAITAPLAVLCLVASLILAVRKALDWLGMTGLGVSCAIATSIALAALLSK